MKIGNRTESDHRLIEIIMNKQIERVRDKKEEREIEDWTEEGRAEYKRRLKEGREGKEEETDGWEKLKGDISIVKKKIKVKKAMLGRRKWWDNECRESKTKLNRTLRKMIRGEIERKVFREQKHEHEKLCTEKEEEEKKREQRKLMEIKDRNDVLKYIKRERQTKGGVNEEISEDEWVRHFMQLLDLARRGDKEDHRRRK